MTSESRADIVSSFTIIKGSLIDETYRTFQHWDLKKGNAENLRALKKANLIGATSTNWLRDVIFTLHEPLAAELTAPLLREDYHGDS